MKRPAILTSLLLASVGAINAGADDGYDYTLPPPPTQSVPRFYYGPTKRNATKGGTKGAFGKSNPRIAPVSDDPKYMSRAARQRLLAELTATIEQRQYAA